MSVRRVVTHVVESEPLFLTLSHQSEWFASQFSGAGIVWSHLSLSSKFTAETADALSEAHRVIVDTANCSPEEREWLVEILTPIQAKVKIIIPIYSFWQLKITGEIPGWQIAIGWQRGQILHWSSVLPEANLIFIRDVLDWQTDLAFSTLLVQHWSSGLFFAPLGKITLTKKQDLISVLLEEIGSPSKGSVLLQSTEFALITLLERAIPLYESMYQTRVEQQQVSTTHLQLLPFPCRTRELVLTLAKSIDRALLVFPTPPEVSQLEKRAKTIIKYMQADPWFDGAEEESNRALKPLRAPEPAVEQVVPNVPLSSEAPVEAGDPPPPETNDSTETPSEPLVAIESPQPTISSVEKEQQLQEDVRRIFSTQDIERHTQTIKRKSRQRRVIKKRSYKRTAVFYLGLTFVAIGLFFAALLGSLQVTQHLVRRELLTVVTNLAQSNTVGQETVRWGQLPVLLALLRPQQALLATLFSLPLLDTSQTLITLHAQLQSALDLRDKRGQSLVTIYNIVTGQNPGHITNATTTLKQENETALKLAEALATTVAQLPEPLQTTTASAAAQLLPNQASRRAELLQTSLLPNLPGLVGSTGTRRYAVVLQNSQELRPTGGFIEAIALLTFENGSLVKQEFFSAYELDKLLPGQVQPPPDLSATLEETQWWLRDANWYADGATAGKQVAWFLEKILLQPTDGIIFINTAGLPQLLKAVGPLEVSAFNEVLTEKNLGERLEFHNELPGQLVAGRPDYRQELLKQLVRKLTSLSPEQVTTFYQALTKLAEEKHLMFAFTNANDQQLFRQLGWTGDLTFPVCPAEYVSTGCVTDGIAIVETNIGANRANAYISRLQVHNTVLTPSVVQHERKIRYTNAAKTSAWPKGDYRLYLRAYVPGQPTNITATVGGVPLNGKEMSVRATEFGSEIGLVISIPIASTKELVLRYELGETFSPTSTYVFYENRQAGMTESIPALTLSYPAAWQVASHAPNAVQGSSQLVFPESTTAHLMRIVQFTPAQ